MSKPNDFSTEWNAPKAGVYDAVLTSIDIAFSEPVALRISYQTETDPPYGLSEYLPVNAPTHHPRYADTAQGKARVAQLARATGIDPKTITSINAIPELFTGSRVKIGVGLYNKDGLSVPVIRTVLGPATGAAPQSERKSKRRKSPTQSDVEGDEQT